MNSFATLAAILCLSLLCLDVECLRQLFENASKFSSAPPPESNATRWAVLVAGSNGYVNYRHQADVCHAYQILKNGGLKDENIIIFMYDDIAFNDQNPRPGIIINKPYGPDVYYGVPKDYTGENVTANNFYAVILGNKTALTGGSGKVMNSGPNDHIFIYYTDHGAPGMVGMPSGADIYAKDLIDVLKQKYEAKAYKNMVFYLEACESGSMFDGILPENLNIYAITAANPSEGSWALYCPGHYPSPPEEYETCLGDLFSVSWIEDSEKHDLQKETLEQQYQVVRRRTLVDYLEFSSHVMQYGSVGLSKESVFSYIGTNPDNDNFTMTVITTEESSPPSPNMRAVNQRDASLYYLWHKFNKAPEGSDEKIEAGKKLQKEISHRQQEDQYIHIFAATLLGKSNASKIIEFVRPAGQPLVDDWDCLKMLVKNYEKFFGSMSVYGKKYTRAFANMCNFGVKEMEMIKQNPNSLSSLKNEVHG